MPNHETSADRPTPLSPEPTADGATVPPADSVDPWATVAPTPPNSQNPSATHAISAASGAAKSPEEVRRIPGYEILRELGRGGMGVVYEARQQGLDRIVALKTILRGGDASREELERFETEALAIAKLHHPNIIQIYAVGNQDGLPFFVMEYCPGGTLSQQLTPKGRTDMAAVTAVVATVARAVHAAHQAGIIHRDLKPANILLMDDGTPKVTDFGLAKQVDSELGRTRSGVIMGTPSYMSPEQASGQARSIGPLTDVYALGAILYDALTGRPPFIATTTWETLHLLSTSEPSPPRKLRPEVPTDLEAIVLQCLDKNPQARYASAADLADDLDRWRKGEPVRAQRSSVMYRLKKRLSKHRWRLAVAAAAILGLIVLWAGLADADYAVPGSAPVQRLLDRHEASLFRKAPSKAQISATAAEHRRELRQRLVDMASARDGWIISPNSSPDPWTQMQGTVALFSCSEFEGEPRDQCIRRMDDMFESKHEFDEFIPGFGWANIKDGNVSAEPNAWALRAFAKALAAPGISADNRKRLRQRFEQVQRAHDNYRSVEKKTGRPTGGWNLFPQQEDPAQANVYVTLITCQALLDMREADLPWHEGKTTRDELLDGSIAWLLQQFNGRGWSTHSTVSDQFNDGFTLQIFDMLLAAEAAGRIDIPDAVLEQIPILLSECGTRSPEHQSPLTLFAAKFRNHDGKEVPWAERRMRPIWFPWAVSCAARWLHRCEQVGAPHDEIVRTRRILGQLLIGIGPAAVEGAKKGEAFVSAEMLIGLTSIEAP